MKYFKNIFFLAFAMMSLASCEDIIELDLENAESKIVIDAVVDATAQNARVILTQSNGFYDDITLDFVADATVNLTLADGSMYPPTEPHIAVPKNWKYLCVNQKGITYAKERTNKSNESVV